jgi:hypothetical protein
VWNPRSCTHSNQLCFPLFLSVLVDPYVYVSTSSQTAMESLSQLLARVLVTPPLAVASRGLQRQGRPLGDDAGFHAVVGNPPYVRQEALGSLKPYLADAYSEVFHGVADLYVYFYEQGLRQLRRGGWMGYVVTNKWLRAGYGEPLRGFFASEGVIEEIVDFGQALSSRTPTRSPASSSSKNRSGMNLEQTATSASSSSPRGTQRRHRHLRPGKRPRRPQKALRQERLEISAIDDLMENIRHNGVR